MNIKKVEYIAGDKKIEILITDSLESLIKADIEKYQKLVEAVQVITADVRTLLTKTAKELI